MDAPAIQTLNFNQSDLSAPRRIAEDIAPVSRRFDVRESALELGLWLSSLESFLSVGNHVLAGESLTKSAARDWTKEFRLTHSSLVLCSGLTFQLGKSFQNQIVSAPENLNSLDADEIYNLSQVLKDSILFNNALLRAAPLKFGEWTAWKNCLKEKLNALSGFHRLIAAAEVESDDFLPPFFQKLLENKSLPPSMEADLKLVLPRFAKILKLLSVVERMLENDEPLKPALLIFTRVYEQIQELIRCVNNRLLRFPNEEDKLFDALDGTAYTASIELRKVYNYELVGLAEIRPTPSVYAKIETAYSLLNDSFQQTLVNFAQLVEPKIKAEELFPNFKTKLKQSLVLRQTLWEILQSVKKAEQDAEKNALDLLHRQLNDFLDSTLHFLFYKDMETVERFIEEVFVTDNRKDLVPVLHRFGAYLETLFGQINMRTVLAQHPFEK
ncbi:MAG TPA: hypothetical protein VNI84_00185 [Pyrinomonadaceae bacterium]|nr:hypothetical protein [Pyrinomonadaceae bacterium]